MSESALTLHQLELEDIPKLKITKYAKYGGKDMKMSKEPTTPTTPEYAKTRGEHFKDMVITALVIGIITFISGMNFQNNQHKAIETAVKGAQTVAPVEIPVKK
jgi:hypothetical protein